MAKKLTGRAGPNAKEIDGVAPNRERNIQVDIAMLSDIEGSMSSRRDAEDRLVNHFLIICGAVFSFATVVSSSIEPNLFLKWGSCATISVLLIVAWWLTTKKIRRNHGIYEDLGTQKFLILKRLTVGDNAILRPASGYGSGNGYLYSLAFILLVGLASLGWSIAVVLLPHVE